MLTGMFLIAFAVVVELARYAVPIMVVCAVLWPLAVWVEMHARVPAPVRVRAATAPVRHPRPHRPHMRHRLV